MTIRATQGIASSYGTYLPGELIDADIPEPIRDAWLAAGIAVDEPDIAPERPSRVRIAPVEKATRSASERATSRRVRTEPAPHRRFVAKTEELN